MSISQAGYFFSVIALFGPEFLMPIYLHLLAMRGFAVGMTVQTTIATALSVVPEAQLPRGSSLVNATRQVAISIGVAALAAVLASGLSPEARALQRQFQEQTRAAGDLRRAGLAAHVGRSPRRQRARGRVVRRAACASVWEGSPEKHRDRLLTITRAHAYLKSLRGFDGLLDAEELTFVMRSFRHDGRARGTISSSIRLPSWRG